MKEARNLNDDAYFSKTFGRAEDDNHVLVELPEDASLTGVLHNKSAEESGEIVEARFTKVLAERDEKNSADSFSDLNTEMEERLVKKMRLVENVSDIVEPHNTSISGHSWIPEVPLNVSIQRTGCMAYLRQHLSTLMDRGDFVQSDLAGDKSVLSIVVPRLPFRINGTADVLLINRGDSLVTLVGVSVVIELMKKVEKSHVPQAVGQLMSCNIKAPFNCRPLSLLTALNDHWHFAWFSDKHVWTHFALKYPKNAFKFLETFVLEGPRSTPFRLPFLPQPVKNLKVDDFLPMTVNT